MHYTAWLYVEYDDVGVSCLHVQPQLLTAKATFATFTLSGGFCVVFRYALIDFEINFCNNIYIHILLVLYSGFNPSIMLIAFTLDNNPDKKIEEDEIELQLMTKGKS
uniref:Uncharacterized protein n=1 Tax=Glossina austeni TaxID=7395 RepID=A0A1A9V5G8_GLOAU